ncbi:MAG: hypothetical protein WBV82_23660, partial [Myxococcaceae bacterium]
MNSQPSKTAANPVGEIRLAALRAAPQPTGWSYLDSRTLTGRTQTLSAVYRTDAEAKAQSLLPTERLALHQR